MTQISRYTMKKCKSKVSVDCDFFRVLFHFHVCIVSVLGSKIMNTITISVKLTSFYKEQNLTFSHSNLILHYEKRAGEVKG